MKVEYYTNSPHVPGCLYPFSISIFMCELAVWVIVQNRHMGKRFVATTEKAMHIRPDELHPSGRSSFQCPRGLAHPGGCIGFA